MPSNRSENEQKFKKKSFKEISNQGKEKKVVIQTAPEKNDCPSKWKQQKDSSNQSINFNDFPTLPPSKTINLEDFPALNSIKNGKVKLSKENEKVPKTCNWMPGNNKNVKKNESSEGFQKLTCENLNENQTDDKPSDEAVKQTEESELQNNLVTKKAEKVELVSKPDGVMAGIKSNKKKSQTSQNNVMQPQRNPNKKKRADPIFINLKEILDNNLTKKKEKPTKKIKSKFQRRIDKEYLSGNILDSSNPKRNRGKHREIKKRKLTNLKLLIIQEKILRQKLKEITMNSYCAKECIDFIDSIDTKAEIEKYLNKLSEKKMRNAEKKKVGVQKNGNEKTNLDNNNVKDDEKLNDGQKQNEKKLIEDSGSALKNNFKCKDFQFSSKLREYCDNLVTPSLNAAVSEFIKELVNLQDRAFSRDPIKAKARRRHVSGIKEAKKYLILKRVKMVIIAPNLEKLQMEGSVYDLINELKSLAESQNVPCVFALNRNKLGRCTKKNVPVSAFAVINYEGIENLFENVLLHLQEAKKEFAAIKPKLKVETNEDKADSVNSQLTLSLMPAFRKKLSVSQENK